MALSDEDKRWYEEKIHELDPFEAVVKLSDTETALTYTPELRSDKSNTRPKNSEEYVHAICITLLTSPNYRYPVRNLYHEKAYEHGRKGSLADEVDLLVLDDDDLPYAQWELKASGRFLAEQEDAIKHQLFGTAPLVGAPKLPVYGTTHPGTLEPELTVICIDYTKYKSYEGWIAAGRPHSTFFPVDYQEIGYVPYQNGGPVDLRLDATQADFRTAATILHNEFFGEHPDNTLFVNLMKCLLAKIYDEKHTRRGEDYGFQILLRGGRPEQAEEVFDRINRLYITAYQRYIDPNAREPDEINAREFAPERVKTVVSVLQSMSITRGAALHSDIIGAFFEEILRAGFKQDKGMYFTHDNLVLFMLESVDIRGLTRRVWTSATHPDNRLPYVIDPACGTGTFLLKAMKFITDTLNLERTQLVVDYDSEQFFNARMTGDNPNYWAENFLYGLDPKFVMAITAKINMVLHGDGSAHIFKQDAFAPLSSFADSKFRPAGDQDRAVSRTAYPFDAAESFDLVISNPPFGITLSSETRRSLTASFSLKESVPSEALFVERCFQLLKPNGRLGVVVPESLLNTSEAIETRLLLYRMFWIRAIVSLPRNIFVDTPTLTSLLFAQKKTRAEITQWDEEWTSAEGKVQIQISRVKEFLTGAGREGEQTPAHIQEQILRLLYPVVTEESWILKRGAEPQVLRFVLPNDVQNGQVAVKYYQDLLRLSGFSTIVRSHVFATVAASSLAQ